MHQSIISIHLWQIRLESFLETIQIDTNYVVPKSLTYESKNEVTLLLDYNLSIVIQTFKSYATQKGQFQNPHISQALYRKP